MIKKFVTYCVILILNVAVATAQKSGGFSDYVDSTKITFYFNVGSAAIDLDYSTNNAMLNKLRKVQEKQGADSIYVPRVDVFAGVSPEGSDEANSQVRWKRLDNSIHLIERYFVLPRYNENYFDAKVTIPQIWQNLATEVRKSDLPNKERVMQCVLSGGNVPAKIQSIDKGATWDKISKQYFPQLRRCDVVIYFKKKEPQKQFPTIEKLLPEEEEEIFVYVRKPNDELSSQAPLKISKEAAKRLRETITEYHPMFAVNTNLLYDGVAAPNFGLELPIGKKLSFNVSYVFPWWSTKNDDWCMQLQYWELEGKYWLGDRDYAPKLTGHAVGLFGGVGYYDFEANKKGYQGEICINAGVSYHYAKSFGREKRWRLQFGGGIGMMRTNYSYYEHRFDHLVWKHDGRYTWIGPTKLDINIGYLIHRKVERQSNLIIQEGGGNAKKK